MKVSVKVGKGIGTFLLGFGVLGILAYIALAFGLVATSLYGLYLAFSASILLGIVTLFVEPSPLIFGLVMLFTGTNLPEKIVAWFNTL